jgi:DNA-binding XRE family transcriptional regulator
MPTLSRQQSELRAIRKQLGLTQAELAAELGVSRWTIIEREAGRVPITRETKLAMLALVHLVNARDQAAHIANLAGASSW